MHCLFGGTTKQVCDLGEVCIIFVLLKSPVAWDWTIVCLIIYLEGIWMEIFHNTESNQKSTLKYAQINCQDCRSVHILQSQSLSMFLFFLH